MKTYSKEISDVICAITTNPKIIKATKYISEKLIIRAVRRTFKGKVTRGNIEISFTQGKPNFAEREFIKRFGVVKSVQLKIIK